MDKYKGGREMKALKITGKILLIIVVIAVIILIAVLLFLAFYPGVGKTPDKQMQRGFAEKTDKFYDGQFHNENDFRINTGDRDPHSDRNIPDHTLPAENLENIERAEKGQMKVAWLGHSSSFVQMGEKNILIDPVLTEYASPVSFVGAKRFSEIALSCENVPEIDVLFISHDHYDHLDYQTIREIDSKVKNYVLPLGIDSYFLGWGVDKNKLHTLDWWEETELDGITYTLTPAQHYTGRNPLKQNITLWGGLYIKDNSHSLYYTGDSGYYDVFQRVYAQLGEADLMLVEDGQYENGWSECHMMPEQSVQAVKDAHAKWAIPVHWGTFSISNHAWNDPIIRITAEAGKQGVNVATPRIGQLIDYDSISEYQERWWAADTEETPAKGNNSTEADIEEETETAAAAEEVSVKMMQMKIGDIAVDVTWEENESVEALKKLCTDEPLTIKMSMYGGFEQVGSIGSKLPRNDKQTTTAAGDIVLYSGNQMVIFYGSNSWAYTRLGHITDKDAEEMAELLSNGNVTITVFNE